MEVLDHDGYAFFGKSTTSPNGGFTIGVRGVGTRQAFIPFAQIFTDAVYEIIAVSRKIIVLGLRS